MTTPSNLVPTRITDLPVAPAPTGTGTVVVVIGGVTYQAVFNDLLTSVEVPSSRVIAAGTGLTGGGDLSQNRTIAVAAGGIGDTQLDTTGVAAGTYGSATEIPQIVVNAQGRITGVTLASPSFAGLVPDSRQIIAGEGLTGGGNLSANRTLAIDFSNATPEPIGSASAGTGTNAARDDHVHPAVDLEDSSQVTGRLGIANGGTGQNITNLTAGAVLYSDGTNLILQTPAGTSGQILTSTGSGAPEWSSAAGSGTVRSVGLAMPDVFEVQDSPVTETGTLTVILANQQPNTVFAGPPSGSTADIPAYRSLVNADLEYATTTVGSTTLTLGGTVTALAGLDTVTVTANPTNALELAPKQYVDSVAQGLDVKASCKYASTANVASISGIVTIDGQSTSTGDRILLKDQSTASENGIYVADDAGAWARSADMDNWSEVPGAFVFIESGDTQADTGWVCTADQGGTIGVTNMPWSQFSGAGTYIAGTGLTLTGTTFSITNTAVVAASYGAADKTLTATVNAQGQLTALADTAIAITNSQVSGSAASGTNADITSLTGLTGGISTPDYIDFDPALSSLPSAVEGRLYYNDEDNTKSLEFYMGGTSLVQKIGEEQYYRIKASAAITKGQVVMFTGTVGNASGGLTGAPATGLLPDQANYILGIATESMSLNDWGYVTYFGEVKGINTSGGGSWGSGDVLYYDPSVAGGLTKTKPTTPNAIAVVAAVVYADASNGILFVRPTFGSVLGGTDGNVQITSLTGGDLLVYDSGDSRWENTAQSALSVGTAANLANGTAGDLPYQTASNTTAFLTLGTSTHLLRAGASAPEYVDPANVSVGIATNVDGGTAGALVYNTASATSTFLSLGSSGYLLAAGASAPEYVDPDGLSVGTATNVAGGNANELLVQSGSGATSFVTAPSSSNTFLEWSGTAFQWTPISLGTVTSVDVSGGTTGLTYSGGPITTSGTITMAGTLITSNGGTGLSSYTAGDLTYYASGTALSKLAIGSSSFILTSSGTAPQWSDPSGVTVGVATNVDGGTAGAIVYNSADATTTFLSLGTSGQVLTAGASAPQYTNQSSLSVGTATNLAGGTGGEIAYQSGAGATGFSAVGTTGQFLISGGTGSPTWTDTISGGTYS